jgi:AcrR family transcriptional regulator
VPEWIPRPSSTKGRLALTALEAFGARGFDGVNVVALARDAGVTTGALYHHFGNKLGIYRVVREEAQRRVLDRMEGAAAARADDGPAEAARAALLVAFDHCTRQGLAGLLAEPEREPETETGPTPGPDPLVAFLARLTDGDGVPRARLLAAAWRAALQAVAEGVPVARARQALAALTIAAAAGRPPSG